MPNQNIQVEHHGLKFVSYPFPGWTSVDLDAPAEAPPPFSA